MSVQHKYRNIIQDGLYIDQIHQNCQQQKHFGRFNKIESKIVLGHTLFEQHVSLPSLNFISSYTKMSYCDARDARHTNLRVSMSVPL